LAFAVATRSLLGLLLGHTIGFLGSPAGSHPCAPGTRRPSPLDSQATLRGSVLHRGDAVLDSLLDHGDLLSNQLMDVTLERMIGHKTGDLALVGRLTNPADSILGLGVVGGDPVEIDK
jgi:hypothetical protein